MSESLKDILLRRDDKQPPEIAVIKAFVQRRFKSDVSVTVNKSQIIINAHSAALAGTLRLNIFELQNTINSPKKLLIRVS
jgi:hypothetical protein